MECPSCGSLQVQRNGYRNKVQCYKCKDCGRQFLESYKQQRYSEEIKQFCIRMYFNGMSTRDIGKLTNIHYTTILSWVRGADANVFEFLKQADGDPIERCE
jgi:transposase-like protein